MNGRWFPVLCHSIGAKHLTVLLPAVLIANLLLYWVMKQLHCLPWESAFGRCQRWAQRAAALWWPQPPFVSSLWWFLTCTQRLFGLQHWRYLGLRWMWSRSTWLSCTRWLLKVPSLKLFHAFMITQFLGEQFQQRPCFEEFVSYCRLYLLIVCIRSGAHTTGGRIESQVFIPSELDQGRRKAGHFQFPQVTFGCK